MSRKSNAQILAAMNVLLTKKQIAAIVGEPGHGIMTSSRLLVVRALMDMGLAENDRRYEAMKRTVQQMKDDLITQKNAMAPPEPGTP